MFDGLSSITRRQLEHPCIWALQVAQQTQVTGYGYQAYFKRLRVVAYPLVLLQRLRAASAIITVPIGKGSLIVRSTDTETVHKIYQIVKEQVPQGLNQGAKVWRYMLPIRPAEPEITPSGYYR